MLEILKRFQPGGLTEKAGLLKALTAPTTATSASEAVDKLRLRARKAVRAKPDPALQVRALDSICRVVLNREAQANFRAQTWRRQHKPDVIMQQETVNQFSRLTPPAVRDANLGTVH